MTTFLDVTVWSSYHILPPEKKTPPSQETQPDSLFAHSSVGRKRQKLYISGQHSFSALNSSLLPLFCTRSQGSARAAAQRGASAFNYLSLPCTHLSPPCSPPDSNGDISQPILQHVGEGFLPRLRRNLEVLNTGKQIPLLALMQSLISQPR